MGRTATLVALLLAAPLACAQEDAFNLGVLGAEGLPIRKPGDELRLPRGSVAIRVTHILETGPARDAGLQVEDVIIGVNGAYLTKKLDPVYQLVDMFEIVTSRKEPKATLSVMRDGKPQALNLRLPALGAHAAGCPLGCTRCEMMVSESLKFLTEQQGADGGFPIGIGGLNGRVVVTSLAGIAFLASGSSPTSGPFADNIVRAAEFVMKNCGRDEMEAWPGVGGGEDGGTRGQPGNGGGRGGANWNQTNWAYGYGSLFLAEVYKADPTPEREQRLTEFMQTIEKNQEPSGGWAHGPGGPNALNYLELQIVGNLELAALGACRKAGLKPSQMVIDKGIAYAIATTGGDGGIGYSDQPGQKGMGDPGRTAQAAWALCLLDMQKHPLFPKCSSFFKRSMEDLPNGHVSPIMHYTSAAFACGWLGGEHYRNFNALFRLEILAARRPDGTFSARPTAESRALRNNTDRTLGASWTTASYAIILQVPRGKLRILIPAK